MPRFFKKRRVVRRPVRRYGRRPARGMVSRFRKRFAKNRVTRRPRRAIGFPVVKTVTLKYIEYVTMPATSSILPTQSLIYRMNNPFAPRDWVGPTHQPMNWDQYEMIYSTFRCLRTRMYVEINPQIYPGDSKGIAFIVAPVYPDGANYTPPVAPAHAQNTLENGGRYFFRDAQNSVTQNHIKFVCQWSPKGRVLGAKTGAVQGVFGGQTDAMGGKTDGSSLPEPEFKQRIVAWPSDDIAMLPWELGASTVKVQIYYTIQFRRGSTTLAQNR